MLTRKRPCRYPDCRGSLFIEDGELTCTLGGPRHPREAAAELERRAIRLATRIAVEQNRDALRRLEDL